MLRSRSVLITGATGILGSWVLNGALHRGYRPTVLLRDKTMEGAQKRLATVLHFLGRSHQADRINIVLGDTSLPNLGLDADTTSRLRETIEMMIHCAASISFHPKHDEDIQRTNVQGVAEVLKLVGGAGIHLYHVSTAFVAGKRRGLVLESESNVGQEFVNAYERSKCEAEGLVHAAINDGLVNAAIFRPAIIIGATKTGRISQFQNFYSFLQLLDGALEGRLSGQNRVRIPANGFGTKNLAPVDWTAEALWHIIDAEGPSGKTYHLTNPEPPTQGGILEWANRILEEVSFEPCMSLGKDLTRAESLIRAALRNYSGYLHEEPVFDRTNTDRALGGKLPFPVFGPDFCGTLIEYARKHNWRGIYAQELPVVKAGAVQSLAS